MKLVELWNELCTPKVRIITQGRKKKISRGMKEMPNLDTWKEVFEKIRDNTFLNGTDKPWRATFDWIIANSDNYVKVLEGNYDQNHEGITIDDSSYQSM